MPGPVRRFRCPAYVLRTVPGLPCGADGGAVGAAVVGGAEGEEGGERRHLTYMALDIIFVLSVYR